jgi:hypothetical protein
VKASAFNVVTTDLKLDINLLFGCAREKQDITFGAWRLFEDDFLDPGAGFELLDNVIPCSFIRESLPRTRIGELSRLPARWSLGCELNASCSLGLGECDEPNSY